MNENHVIIVAGGSGQRMGTAIPKQFLHISGKPVLMHTIERFYAAIPHVNIVLVLPQDHHSTWNSLVIEHLFSIPFTLTTGGETRFHSVKNGLKLISSGFVGVHDGVRPLVSEETIQKCYKGASEKGNAVPVIDVSDSLRQYQQDGSSISVDRANYCIVQTPQVFDVEQMKLAFEQDYVSSFTDCASVMEKAGHKINLVEGNSENIKITKPSDFILAETLLKTY
jgi:2-C-methyl-D-erythritol 4-phosphate cytidylyltransferase